MQYQFIHTNHSLYPQAVELRVKAFFEGMSNEEELIHDVMEEQSIHVVCVDQSIVVGTGRLTFLQREALISQMAVKQSYQGQGVGKTMLKKLILKCKESGAPLVSLSARTSALDFYIKAGFTPVSPTYPSSKTGILHQKMEKRL